MKYKVEEKTRLLDEFFQIDRVLVEHETYKGDSLKVQRYHISRPEVVAVVLENVESQKIVMVEQFRYASTTHTSGWSLEIVGGMIDPDEDPEHCGLRETLEETGYQVTTLEHWTSYYPTVGICDEYIHLYYGQVVDQDKIESGGGLAHENEDIQVREVEFQELLRQIQNGQLKDAKSIVGLQWLALQKMRDKEKNESNI